MPDNFADFPSEEAHKETPAAVKAATDALFANKKIMLQQFDRLTCPTNTDPAIARAEAHTLLLDSVFGAQIYLASCPPETHDKHSDYITYGQGASIKDRLGQHVTVVTQILKDILVKWQCPVVVSNFGHHDYLGLIKAFELEIKFNPTIAISSYSALLNTSNNIFASVTDEKSGDNYTRVNDFLKRIKFAQKLYDLSYMRPNPAGEFLFKDKEIDWSSFSQNLKKPDFVITDTSLKETLISAKGRDAVLQTLELWLYQQTNEQREDENTTDNPFAHKQSTFSAKTATRRREDYCKETSKGVWTSKSTGRIVKSWQTETDDGKLVHTRNGGLIKCKNCEGPHNRDDPNKCPKYDKAMAWQTAGGRGRGSRGRGTGGGRGGRSRDYGRSRDHGGNRDYGGGRDSGGSREYSSKRRHASEILCIRDNWEGGCRNYKKGHCDFKHENSKKYKTSGGPAEPTPSIAAAVSTAMTPTLNSILQAMQAQTEVLKELK